MARDLILHIGIHKTGTTSIQRVMALRRKEILEQDMYYPRTPGYEKHALLASAAHAERDREPNRVMKYSSPDVKLAKFRAKFDAEMRAIPANVRRVIISAEQFSYGLKDIPSVQNLRDMVAPHVDKITVVAYIRRPDLHLTSLYSEMIRWGDARPPGLAGLNLPAGHKYNYYRMLNRWAKVFGKGTVKPYVFERIPGQKFDVVQHFTELCGLKLSIPTDKSAVNQSLSLPAQLVLVELARQINAGGKHANVVSAKWRSIVDAAATALPGKGWLPTQSEAQAFNARFAKNMERVRARWFADRPTLFSTDYSELPVEPMTVGEKELFEASVRVLHKMGDKAMRLEDDMAHMKIAAAEENGDGAQVQRLLARRIELFPENVEVQVKMARHLAKGGDLAAARHMIAGALEIEPTHKEAKAMSKELAAQRQPRAEPAGQEATPS